MRVSLTLPAVTAEHIRSTVSSLEDLTEFEVDAALELATVEADDLTWTAAEWSGSDVRWRYPGGYERGVYAFWVRVNGGTVTPVRRAGLVELI